MNKQRGTYLVTFSDNESMIFGNNYKPWWMHAREFIYRNYGNQAMDWRYADVASAVTSVQYSNQQFYDDGGLKWCSLSGYQKLVDEVCKKDRLAPVDVNDIVFASSSADKAILTKKLKEY